MAYTEPNTLSTGDLITAAQMNLWLRDNMAYFKDRVGSFVNVTTTSESAMPAGTSWNTRTIDTIVSWDGDNLGTSIPWFGLGSNIFQLTGGGNAYLIEAAVLMAVDSDEFGIRIAEYNTTTSSVGDPVMVSMNEASDDDIQKMVRIPPTPIVPAQSTVSYVLQSRAEVPRATSFQQNLGDMPNKYQTFLRIVRIA